MIATAIFFSLGLIFMLLWLAEKGYIEPRYVLGVCGFQQRTGLPCPGCGWTHSAQAFSAGDVVRSLRIQPAAAFFCATGLVVAILALHSAIFGIHFYLRRVMVNRRFWKYSLIIAVCIIIAGWLANLIQCLA